MSGPAFVLVAPTLPENVGAVARVMANFGLTDLRVVASDLARTSRAIATAAGGATVLYAARRYETLDAALADRRRVYATAALPKSLPLPVITPRGLGPALRAATIAGHDAAVVFGTERTGLSYEDVARADVLVRIPTDPACRALNLAQAAALCAWEWCAAGEAGGSGAGGFPPPATPPGLAPATRDAVEGLVRHLESALDAAGQLQEPALRARLLRSLRVAFGRGLSDAEVTTLRGVVSALTRGRRG